MGYSRNIGKMATKEEKTMTISKLVSHEVN